MDTTRIPSDTLLQQLRWRYATKQFDAARKIPQSDWAALEEALLLTPSSFGLQPWKFLVITDSQIRESLVPVSWGQRQVADCSHLVVFAIKKELKVEDLDLFMARIAEVRQVGVETLAGYRSLISGTVIDGANTAHVGAWIHRQAYIALGNFMTSAALLGIDTCPLEGFAPEKYDEILGLSARGLTAGVACAAGYRSADDKHATLPKVRFKPEDVIEHL
ncbi:MAG: NAD(P)H-dependent oxidoreductase [Verrucomicrobiota bacterium]